MQAAALAEPAAIAEAAADVWAPTQGIQQLLVWIHGATGLDWWQSIMLTTFGVRLLTFPVMLFQVGGVGGGQARVREGYGWGCSCEGRRAG